MSYSVSVSSGNYSISVASSQYSISVALSGVTNPSIYDPDYQTILDRATTLGYTLPSLSQRSKQNQLVLDLKSANIWNSLDIFYVFSTEGSSDFATLNWKAPSAFQITKVNSPTFTTNEGFNGDGSTSYLDTNWIPSTDAINLTLNDASAGCYCFTPDLEPSKFLFGCLSTDGITWNPRSTSNTGAFRVNQTSSSNYTNPDASGFWHLQRWGVNSVRSLRNGTVDFSTTTGSGGIPSVSMAILGVNNMGSFTNFTTRKVGMFFAGASLLGSQVDFYTAWNTYLTSL